MKCSKNLKTNSKLNIPLRLNRVCLQSQCLIQNVCFRASPSLVRSTADKGLRPRAALALAVAQVTKTRSPANNSGMTVLNTSVTMKADIMDKH